MLAVLSKRNLTDVLAIVTRYFGGTLLGAGGLVRAYGQAVTDAVHRVGIVERRPIHLVEVDADHGEAGRLENALRASRFELAEIRHEASVTFQMRLDASDLIDFDAWLADATNGRAMARVAGETVIEVPVPF
jgi:putative IMPACT (imprinted ancient) family translation regulator